MADRHKVHLHVNTASVLINEAGLLLHLHTVCCDVLVQLVMHHKLQKLRSVFDKQQSDSEAQSGFGWLSLLQLPNLDCLTLPHPAPPSASKQFLVCTSGARH